MTSDPIFLQYLAGAFICGLIGAAIGANKGRGGAGFFFGLLLGPIGWLLIAIGPTVKPRRDYMDSLLTPPRAAPVAPPPSASDATQALLDLKRLLDAGAITQAEFDGKKKILLDRVAGAPAPARSRPASSVPYRIPGIND